MVITPFVSVGILNFSDSRQNIRTKLKSTFVEGVKEFEGIKDCYDYFSSDEIFVYYDKLNKVTAFEFFKPGPTFKDNDILKTPYNKLLKIFQNLDTALIVEITGFRSDSYGIGVDAPDSSTKTDALVDSTIIYRKGYYEES